MPKELLELSGQSGGEIVPVEAGRALPAARRVLPGERRKKACRPV
jgi:hypothetical protein